MIGTSAPIVIEWHSAGCPERGRGELMARLGNGEWGLILRSYNVQG